ncbi:P40 [Operophtera brumata nucleopolyhedrovirus]|uniref:P40 n=1 Tax=Operophtera brumata nucleopolyhedrovirus TaxID=1046267 RepID=A0A2H4UZW6_9ABAC|nr:P40 [Operophtera brumata nucleopolyhedrovirus]AUA60316.1 P40 [Operophtera brumata nucleopolyhedrovirus]
MSSVSLFLGIETLKNKIDPAMRMPIWPKFFPILVNQNAGVDFTITEIVDLLTNTARMSLIRSQETSAALTSQFANPTTGTVQQVARPPATSFIGVMKPTPSDNSDLASLQRKCRQLLKYYTEAAGSTTEFFIGDITKCMIFLKITPSYASLYNFLQESMYKDYDCPPALNELEKSYIVNQLREITGLDNKVDYEALKILRVTLGRLFNYPIARYPRIILMEGIKKVRNEKLYEIEEIITQRWDTMIRLEPQFVIDEKSRRIVENENIDLTDQMLKSIEHINVDRVFTNAMNAILHSTIENCAMSNCRFNIEDYNHIYNCADVDEVVKKKRIV